MKLKKELKEEAKFGTIVDLGKDGKDPEVQIRGYGRLPLSVLKQKVINKLSSMIVSAKSDLFKAVLYGSTQELPHFIQAILDVEAELTTPAIKRKIANLKK